MKKLLPILFLFMLPTCAPAQVANVQVNLANGTVVQPYGNYTFPGNGTVNFATGQLRVNGANITSGGGGGGTWGSITGTLSNQTDLQTALNLLAPLASPALTGLPTITGNLAINATTAVTLNLTTTNSVDEILMNGSGGTYRIGLNGSTFGWYNGSNFNVMTLDSLGNLTIAGNVNIGALAVSSYVTTDSSGNLHSTAFSGNTVLGTFNGAPKSFLLSGLTVNATTLTAAGGVTSVTSADTNIGVATGTTTPVLTLNTTLAGTFTFNGTTQATTTTSGAIIDSGGLGVAKNAFIGGTLNATGASTLTGAVVLGSTLTLGGNETLAGFALNNGTISGNVTYPTNITVNGTNTQIVNGATLFNYIPIGTFYNGTYMTYAYVFGGGNPFNNIGLVPYGSGNATLTVNGTFAAIGQGMHIFENTDVTDPPLNNDNDVMFIYAADPERESVIDFGTPQSGYPVPGLLKMGIGVGGNGTGSTTYMNPHIAFNQPVSNVTGNFTGVLNTDFNIVYEGDIDGLNGYSGGTADMGYRVPRMVITHLGEVDWNIPTGPGVNNYQVQMSLPQFSNSTDTSGLGQTYLHLYDYHASSTYGICAIQPQADASAVVLGETGSSNSYLGYGANTTLLASLGGVNMIFTTTNYGSPSSSGNFVWMTQGNYAGTPGNQVAKLFVSGNFDVGATTSDPGYKLRVEGTANITGAATFGSTVSMAIKGTFTLSSGAATVSNANITASSVIIITMHTPSGTIGLYTPMVATKTAGTGFTVATLATDNSTYDYVIIN